MSGSSEFRSMCSPKQSGEAAPNTAPALPQQPYCPQICLSKPAYPPPCCPPSCFPPQSPPFGPLPSPPNPPCLPPFNTPTVQSTPPLTCHGRLSSCIPQCPPAKKPVPIISYSNQQGCCCPPPPRCPPPKPYCPPCKPPPKRPGFFLMGCLWSAIKTGIIFGAGMYTGVYVAQNYQIDKVEDPKVLFEKAQAFIKSKFDD